MSISKSAVDLIVEFEVGSQTQYNSKYKNPIWPQAASGVTIGIGYDIGYVTAKTFASDWSALPKADIDALSQVAGITGAAAKAALPQVKSIVISWQIANDVFTNSTLPKYESLAVKTFPGLEQLHEDIRGAIVSLVYNRGASLSGDRRREMKDIKHAIVDNKLDLIPGLFRSMVRLWIGTSIEKGMTRRRNAEAQLVEAGLAATKSGTNTETKKITPVTTLKRTLQLGTKGEDVEELQMALKQRGIYSGEIDGDFGPITDTAVRLFQAQAGVSVDGVVGPITWEKLDGKSSPEVKDTADSAKTKREQLADFAEAEASKNLIWVSSSSEAEKYLSPLRPIMIKLKHIGTTPVWFNWCAAFVTYCARQTGYTIPDQPSGFYASMALVEAWKYWAKQNGTYHDPTSTDFRKGDIVLFEWKDEDATLDHIGFVLDHVPGSTILKTAEGNRHNKSVVGTRNTSSVAGIIRLT